MDVTLTPRLEELVNQKIQSGMYHSASQVIRSALRLLEEKDSIRELKLAALRNAVQKGLESGAATPLDMGDVIRRGQKRLEESSFINGSCFKKTACGRGFGCYLGLHCQRQAGCGHKEPLTLTRYR